jgi:serine/threonine protein kinase
MLDADMHFTVADAVQHGIRLMKGLSALHRLDIAHRDIKPANIHLGRDGRLRILDLGVAVSFSEDEIAAATPAPRATWRRNSFAGEWRPVPRMTSMLPASRSTIC